MVAPAGIRVKAPLAFIFCGALVAVALLAGWLYFRRAAPQIPQYGPASPEAKAYVSNLTLSDVTMKASENFMKQQVVEVEGNIKNNGPRPLGSVDVYCLFRGVDGQVIYRERAPVVLRSKAGPVNPSETRHFRLAFDSLPDGWNQAMPTLVIARITFAR